MPKRARCVPFCQATESVKWKRLPRFSAIDDCPIVRGTCGMFIVGAPIPRQPGQSCAVGGTASVLRKKYEKRRSLTSVERKTLVRPNMLWSTHANWRVQLDGYALACWLVGTKARLPSCENRRNPVCASERRPSSRKLSWFPNSGLEVTPLR